MLFPFWCVPACLANMGSSLFTVLTTTCSLRIPRCNYGRYKNGFQTAGEHFSVRSQSGGVYTWVEHILVRFGWGLCDWNDNFREGGLNLEKMTSFKVVKI